MAFGILAGLSGLRGLLSGGGIKLAVIGFAILAITGTITYQKLSIDNLEVQIRALEAEKRMQAAQCNERIMGTIAASQDTALKAQAEAVLKERAEWQVRVGASQKSALVAAQSRTEAEKRADELQRRLNEVYEANQDAQVWRDAPIPDSILGLRDR